MIRRFAKVAADLDSNPKILRAGRNGREVYLFVLRRNAGLERDGRVPASNVELWYLADQLKMSEAEAQEGVSRCIAAGLLRITRDSVLIAGWDDDWAKRPLDEAERKAKQRSKERPDPVKTRTSDDESRNVTTDNVTDRDSPDSHPSDQSREDQSRGDPPVVPPSGGSSDSPQLAAFKADVDAVTHPATDEPQREANAIAQAPTRRNRRARRTATEMPTGWHPRPEESAKARELGLDPAHEAEQFRDHHVARASTFADWDAAFRTWLRNARRFAGRTGRNQPTALELQLERVAMLERQEREQAERQDT